MDQRVVITALAVALDCVMERFELIQTLKQMNCPFVDFPRCALSRTAHVRVGFIVAYGAVVDEVTTQCL